MLEDKPCVDNTPDERTDILISDRGIDPVELLISQVAQTRRELQAQEVEQAENQVSVTSRIRCMFGNRQFGLVVQNAVEHVSCIANRGWNWLAALL